jgi:hypothetical protein
MKDDHHLNDNTATNTALLRILHIKYTTQKNMVVNGQYKILFLPFLSTLHCVSLLLLFTMFIRPIKHHVHDQSNTQLQVAWYNTNSEPAHYNTAC